jgi:hypothetical protein
MDTFAWDLENGSKQRRKIDLKAVAIAAYGILVGIIMGYGWLAYHWGLRGN